MNPLYRVWWRFLMDLRPMLRYLAERFPRQAPWAVRTRAILHWIIGNPVQILATTTGFMAWAAGPLPGRWFLGLLVVTIIGFESYCRICFRQGHWIIGWREAWRIRRRWPSDWAIVAAKTARVQAEVGTSKEPISSAVLRPVADHPKLSWWPQIHWPVVSWWVGPPPGRSLLSLDELTVVLAANISHVADVEVDYERENDSHGRLAMSFEDVLESTSTPPWNASPGAVLLGGSDDRLGAAIAEFDHHAQEQPPVYPPLRAVDDEEAS